MHFNLSYLQDVIGFSMYNCDGQAERKVVRDCFPQMLVFLGDVISDEKHVTQVIEKSSSNDFANLKENMESLEECWELVLKHSDDFERHLNECVGLVCKMKSNLSSHANFDAERRR